MNAIRKIAIITAVLLCQVSTVWAVSQKSEDQAVWNSYIDTKKSFEKDVHALVSKKWSNEAQLADAHLKLELARLDRKDSQFDYVLKNNPQRIDRKKGLDDFADLDWSDKDENALSSMDKGYASESLQVKQLEKKYDNLKGRSDFESHLKEVKGTVEYRSMEDRYNDMVAKLETTWKNIKHDWKN